MIHEVTKMCNCGGVLSGSCFEIIGIWRNFNFGKTLWFLVKSTNMGPVLQKRTACMILDASW